MKIAQFGTFDVGNYGDLLFPHIARWRYPDIDWVHVSPLGGSAPFTDALPTVGYLQAKKGDYDGVLVGGGNILSTRRTSLREYASIARTAYPSIWLGAAAMARKQKIPVAFNAPSIMTKNFHSYEKFLIKGVFRSAAYLAMRDAQSVQIASSGKVECHFVPDSVFDLSRMWPKSALVRGESKNYIAIHVNRRYIGSIDSVCQTLSRIANAKKAELHIIPIAACHGDRETAKLVALRSSCMAKVADAERLMGIAADIAYASMYIGSSMHGFITAVSYGVPALLVLEGKTPMRKFQGVLDTVGADSSVICSSWEDALSSLDRAFVVSPERLKSIHAMLDAHWQMIAQAFRDPERCTVPFRLMFWKQMVFLHAAVNTTQRAKRFIARLLRRLIEICFFAR